MYGGWGGVGDWEGVSDGGRGLKLKISKFCNFTQKEHLPAQKPKFIFKKQKIVLNMRILIFCWATLQKRAPTCSETEVYSQKTENRPEYWDFDFLLGNPPTSPNF